MSEKRIVEINGIKVEVDLRDAKRVDSFKVGDKVKVLIKDGYSDNRSVYPGVVVGFEDFKTLPTIIVAYVKTSYGEASLDFFYFNSESTDVDMVPADNEYLPIEKSDILDKFNREIEKKKIEVAELEQKKSYFLKRFGQYFKGE